MFLTGILNQANSCALSHHNNSHLATLIPIPAASRRAFYGAVVSLVRHCAVAIGPVCSYNSGG